jgi:hypothetical protein
MFAAILRPGFQINTLARNFPPHCGRCIILCCIIWASFPLMLSFPTMAISMLCFSCFSFVAMQCALSRSPLESPCPHPEQCVPAGFDKRRHAFAVPFICLSEQTRKTRPPP